MAIVDELKKLILVRNGSVEGINNISDAVKVLAGLEEADVNGIQTIADGIRAIQEDEAGITGENPLKALAVTSDFEATTEKLLGKSLSDLHDNVEVDMDTCKITGTLKYVDDYTGFSGDTSLQSGHYLAIYCDVEDVTGVTLKVKRLNEVTLDSDKILIARIDNKPSTPLVVTATKEGCKPVRRTFDLSSLVLAPEA